jgi:ABC-type uncharacterized transport system substrate-binding protein
MELRAMGLQIQVLKTSTSREIDAAFDTFARERPDAPFVNPDPFFSSRRVQLVHLASHHRVPATYGTREFAEAGGLVSYGPSLTDAWRQVGVGADASGNASIYLPGAGGRGASHLGQITLVGVHPGDLTASDFHL